jgi:hypothetical protein
MDQRRRFFVMAKQMKEREMNKSPNYLTHNPFERLHNPSEKVFGSNFCDFPHLTSHARL